jgi:PAS domain S-box-containing protein
VSNDDSTKNKGAKHGVMDGEFEELLAFAVNQTDDVIVVFRVTGLDDPEARAWLDSEQAHTAARAIYINDAYTRLTGIPREEALGWLWPQFIAEGVELANISHSHTPLESGSVLRVETRVRTHERDEHIWVDGSARISRSEDGEDVYVVSTWRNITPRRQLQAQLMQMERVVAIGSLAAGIGHEINNPLAYVQSNIDYCTERWGELLDVLERFRKEHGKAYLDGQMQREFHQFASALAEAGEGIDRVSSIVADLREFTNMRNARLGPVELRRSIDSAINLARNELRQKAQLEIQLDSLPLVLGNEIKINQVFLNLILNAVQAIPPGSPLKYKIDVTATYLEKEGMVEVCVQDNGPGIPAAILEKVFDPFFTTRARGAGSGLGLTVAQNIMHVHGGQISVESTPGEGTTVKLLFRVAEREQPSGPYQAVVFPEVERVSLLVIDDEAPILRVIERLLSRDHKVTGVLDAITALSLIEGGQEFDVILCDVMMSSMDGVTFYEHLVEDHPALAERLVFLTGGALTESQVRLLKERDIPIIYKPFNKRDLLYIIADRFSYQKATGD